MRTKAEIETRLASVEALAREMEFEANRAEAPTGNLLNEWRRGRLLARDAMNSQAVSLRWVLTDAYHDAQTVQP